MKKWSDIKAKGMSAERKARLDQEVRAELLELELRELAGKTQAEAADRVTLRGV